MVVDTALSPYTLDRVDEHHWLIHDQRMSPKDASHLVACLQTGDEDGVEVIWLQPIPLPTRYNTAGDTLDDLSIWAGGPRGGVRPLPIPHLPPSVPIRPRQERIDDRERRS